MDQNKGGKIVLLIFLLICSGLGIAAFIMSFTNRCGEGFTACEKCWAQGKYSTFSGSCESCPENTYQTEKCADGWDNCTGFMDHTECAGHADKGGVCSKCIQEFEIPNYYGLGKRARMDRDGRYCKCKEGYVRDKNGWCKLKPK